MKNGRKRLKFAAPIFYNVRRKVYNVNLVPTRSKWLGKDGEKVVIISTGRLV